MSYRVLYEYAQKLPVPISRKYLVPKVIEILGRERKPLVMKAEMDTDVLLGLFVHPGDVTHKLAHMANGEPIIIMARALNHCWTRFVFIKELMHYFDPDLQKVGSNESFEQLLQEFSAPKMAANPGYDSEVQALWMALGLVCPESQREEFARARDEGAITDDQIAEKLKIPAYYVPHLFVPEFKSIIQHFIDCC